MWKLSKESDSNRLYSNSVTGSECSTSKVHTDRDGNSWWAFDNLMLLPYTRNFAATKISGLYQLGLSKEDLNGHISRLKTILKSPEPEKYEKAYAEVLDFENKAQNATDAVKQMSSLVCVYYLLNDEKIDAFDSNLQIYKMSLLESDLEAQSFFLNKLIEDMSNYSQFLGTLSTIASSSQNGT